MTKRFHMDKGRSKNLTASLVLCFYSFFIMFLTLNPSDNFDCLLALLLITFNKVVNNLDIFIFLEQPNRYTNWVVYLGTRCFQLTPERKKTTVFNARKISAHQ